MKVKYLLIVRDVEPPQGRGKMAHTLTNALELNASGHDVKVLFEGQGVEWLRLFEQREDGFTKGYGQRFDQAHQAGVLAGACNFCSSIRFKTSDSAARLSIPLYGEENEHGSLVPFLEAGWQVLSF